MAPNCESQRPSDDCSCSCHEYTYFGASNVPPRHDLTSLETLEMIRGVGY